MPYSEGVIFELTFDDQTDEFDCYDFVCEIRDNIHILLHAMQKNIGKMARIMNIHRREILLMVDTELTLTLGENQKRNTGFGESVPFLVESVKRLTRQIKTVSSANEAYMTIKSVGAIFNQLFEKRLELEMHVECDTLGSDVFWNLPTRYHKVIQKDMCLGGRYRHVYEETADIFEDLLGPSVPSLRFA